MNKEMKQEEIDIRSELANFYGTEHYYQLGLYKNVVATDGVKFLAERAKCFWLTDLIAGIINSKNFEDEGMLFFKCIKNDDSSMNILCDDGNGNVLTSMVVSTLDFPLSAQTIYASFVDYGDTSHWVLMLPSEY